MHELSITENLLEIALRHAPPDESIRIRHLYLVIGQLSSIVDDSVQFYWDIISKETRAEGAQLHFRRIPIEMQCLECNLHYKPTGEDLACPQCGSIRVKVLTGEEFFLEAIDVESTIGEKL